jgi:hypothetical protein
MCHFGSGRKAIAEQPKELGTMTRTKLLAASILASTALLGATVASQARSPAPPTGPQQVAVDQSTQGTAARSAQAAEQQAKSLLMAQDDPTDDDLNGVEDDGRNDLNGTEDDGRNDSSGVEDDGSDDAGEAEDDDRDDSGQTGENEGGQTGENEGEHED